MKQRLRRLVRALFGGCEQRPLFSILATTAFFSALVAVHLHHEAWRDEVHCWSVGRNSAGLWDLMRGDRRYDGHPFLPYYVIYLASRVVRGVAGLHALTIVTATTAAYLWLRGSGAPRLVRLALLPSYLFFYEYSVVGRSYILGALVLFCFCACYKRDHVRYVPLAALLSALALTSAYGAIMAGALAMFLFTRGLAVLQKDASGRRRWLATRAGFWWGLGLFLLGIALTGWTSMPPKDEYFATVWYTKQMGVENVHKALQSFWWAFVPANVDWYSVRFLGIDTPALKDFIYWFGAALGVGWVIALRRVPMLALGFLLAALTMGFFQQAKYPGGLRHVGNIYLLCLACGWLATRQLRGARRLRLFWTLLAGCLYVQLKSGYSASVEDWKRPFSGALEAAQVIAKQAPPGTLIIGSNDFIVSPIAGYLDRSFLFADTGDFGQSVVSHNRRYAVTDASILDVASQNLPGRERVIVVTNFSVGRRNSALNVKLLHATSPAIVSEEHFYIYEVRAAAPAK